MSEIPIIAEDFPKYDNAVGGIMEKWKDNKEIKGLMAQMDVLGKNMSKLRLSKDPEIRKKYRLVWQKAAQQYWDIVWAIVEAKIDAGPPDELEFDPCERLLIDFGHLYSDYTTPNESFAEQLTEPSAVDMYQYNRLTDYLKEQYALIFNKPYTGPSGGVPLEEKLKRFNSELQKAQTRRKMAINTLLSTVDIGEDKADIDRVLAHLEEGLSDAVETDMRTKRIREADDRERNIIRDHARNYEVAERTFWAILENIEKRLTSNDEPPEEPVAVAEAVSAEEQPQKVEDAFDPFKEISESEIRKKGAATSQTSKDPEPEEFEATADSVEEPASESKSADRRESAENLNQSLKIIENVLALHDRTKFLTSLIVHVTNEAERWKTRLRMAENKYKGQGLPALKMELREGLNHKKEFMTLAARTARVDTSPLCQNSKKPISFKRAGEIMMDLTPLDPDMLRAARIRMYGIPRVILIPGQGLGVYDWEDNSIMVPIFDAGSDIKSFCFALASFRWDNDEDRTLKDTYALLKQNKGKGIRAMQEAFMNDYFMWISKEKKGYRILPRDVSKWFKTFFKQKSGVIQNSPDNKRRG